MRACCGVASKLYYDQNNTIESYDSYQTCESMDLADTYILFSKDFYQEKK